MIVALLVPMAMAGSVTRSFSSNTVAPGGEVTVTLNVNLDPGDNVVTIEEERFPVGWTVVESSLQEKPNSANAFRDVFFQNVQNTYTYTLRAPGSAGQGTFVGTYVLAAGNQITGQGPIGGSSQVTVQAAAPVPTDTDGDGIPDSSDNCRSISNAGQTNTDGDPFGDACDEDDDNDNICDPGVASPRVSPCKVVPGGDNCPLMSNGDQSDADVDGIGDVCDPFVDNLNDQELAVCDINNLNLCSTDRDCFKATGKWVPDTNKCEARCPAGYEDSNNDDVCTVIIGDQQCDNGQDMVAGQCSSVLQQIKVVLDNNGLNIPQKLTGIASILGDYFRR